MPARRTGPTRNAQALKAKLGVATTPRKSWMGTIADTLGTSSLELAVAPHQKEDADRTDESDDEEDGEDEASPPPTAREALRQQLNTAKVCNPPIPPFSS